MHEALVPKDDDQLNESGNCSARFAMRNNCKLSFLWTLFCNSVQALGSRFLFLSPRERKVPGSNPACAGIFSGSSHTSDFKIGTPLATLPGAWRYRVSTGTGRPGVSIL